MPWRRRGGVLSLGLCPPAFQATSRTARRSDLPARALTLLLLGLLVLGASSGFVGLLATPARAAACDQGGTLISGDWTVTTAQVCKGIFYTVDGSVTIASGGSLTLVDGGLDFAKDAAHTGYALTVNAGGSLSLDHSTVTTNPTAIQPYLLLALTVSGAGSRFTMTNGSVLQFPGWFNATGATISLTDSEITGFTDSQLQGTGLPLEDNHASAVVTWSSTAAVLARSHIDHLFENSTLVSANVSARFAANVSVLGGSTFTAYDSYIGVDYSNITGLHNQLRVDATSAAYLYNVTIDRSQDPTIETKWKPSFLPDPGGKIDLLRWLNVGVVDATDFPVPGAGIWSTFSANGTTASYPDNGFSTVPNAETLAYLGRTASGAAAWNRTDLAGQARIPLFTDEITVASLPNADSFGNFRYAVTYNTSSVSGGVAFNPFPAGTAADNVIAVDLTLPGVYVRAPADLALRASDFPAVLNVSQSRAFSLPAVVRNLGQTTATGVSLAAYLDGNRSSLVAQANGLTVSQTVNVTLAGRGIAALGTHTLMLVVDPNGTIYEGGAGQKANNFLNLSLNVIPPPGGFVAIGAPDGSQNLVPGTTVSVSGYVRDPNAVGIVGVPLTIELRAGNAVLASTSVVSGVNGFFVGTVTLPGNLTDGSYVIAVTPGPNSILSDARVVTVATAKPLLNTNVPLLGIPWWLFVILLAVVAAAIIGITVYIKVYGLGKMVECGECGAFIHADAAKCPRCGVEFEKDLAKCSNCQAWIPVEVRQCPECGIEFTTGELDAEHYQEKMRLQYEEIVEKFQAEAQHQLRRSLTEKEFQEWWRTQPSFVTFDEWRREEEEMRRTGTKPCPKCGALNSVTAKICHSCGAVLKGQLPRRNGTTAQARQRQASGPAGPEGRSMISPSTGPEEETPPTKEPGGNGADSQPKKNGP